MSSQLFAANSAHRSCTWRCRSQQHVSESISAVIKSSESIDDIRLKTYLIYNCSSFPKHADRGGRSLAHWAASCQGRHELLEWLLDEFGGSGTSPTDMINAKDAESGYTPLHRALLHGQLTNAQVLIEHDASLISLDREGMTPLDIVRRDQGIGAQSFGDGTRNRQHQRVDGREGEWFNLREPTEVFSCGENVTSNLGHRVPKERTVPELVDYFSRRGISIQKVSMSKWHTAFLTAGGSIYTCGHGSFGRLGHGDTNDRTVPARVAVNETLKFVDVAVGDEHTIAVTADGSALAWGGNRRKQLGLSIGGGAESFMTPQLVGLHKNVKDHSFIGCASYGSYSILWTNEAVYGCGANDGQFGRCASKSDQDVSILRPLLGVASPVGGSEILDMACGDGAIAILTKKFDLLLLNQYESRRILSRLLNFTRLFMNVASKKTTVGDRQQHATSSAAAQSPNSSSTIRLTLFSQGGFMYYWDTIDQQLRNCAFDGFTTKMIYPRDACTFGGDGLFLITEDGKVYRAKIGQYVSPMEKSKPSSKHHPSGVTGVQDSAKSHTGKRPSSTSTGDFKWTSNTRSASRASCGGGGGGHTPDDRSPMDNTDHRSIILSSPISSAHRAVSIACTSDGRNYCIIQQDPKLDLIDLPVKSTSTMREDYGRLLDEAAVEDCLHDVRIRTNDGGARWRPVHKYVLSSRSPYFAERIQPSIDQLQLDEPGHTLTEFALDRILEYFYTDDCELFHVGPYGPAQNYAEDVESWNGGGGGAAGKWNNGRDPIREVLDASKRLKIKVMTKRLETLRWNASTNSIEQISKYYPNQQQFRFEPNAFPELCDVRLKCKDGTFISAHRCVLSSRAEYFRCMFTSGFWSETNRDQTLKVDIDASVLTPVLYYLYTDELPAMIDMDRKEAKKRGGGGVGVERDTFATVDKEMLEHYGKILVCADQWLLDRLRQLCEIELAARITLRNATDMLEFAEMINADQLFASCAQFISLNLCALLETNSLRNLSPECLERVGEYYRNMYPHVAHRAITPSSEPPSIDQIESINRLVHDESGMTAEDFVQNFVTTYAQVQLANGSPGVVGSAKKKRPIGGGFAGRSRKTSENATTITGQAANQQSKSPIQSNIQNRPSAQSIDQSPASIPSPTDHRPLSIGSPNNQIAEKPINQSPSAISSSMPLAISKTMNAIPAQEQKVVAWKIDRPKGNVTKPIDMPTPAAPIRTKNKPWNALALSPTDFPPEVSLRDLMQAEERKQAAQQVDDRRKSISTTPIRSPVTPTYKSIIDQKSPPSAIAWSQSPRTTFASVMNTGDFPSISPAATNGSSVSAPKKSSIPTRGEQNGAVANGNNGSNRRSTFDDIVKEEKSKEAARTRILNKPLKIIQDEELAMQELSLIYQIDDEWDECITIERAVDLVSEPTWQAHVGSPPRF